MNKIVFSYLNYIEGRYIVNYLASNTLATVFLM
jgi:hypothetical protein